MSCNICNPDLLRRILNGELGAVAPEEQVENCRRCNAPPRLKTFQIAYHRHIRPNLIRSKAELAALAISGVKYEQEIVAWDFGTLVSASLYGNYGNPTIRTDIRDLKEFSNDSMDFVWACNVLDYVLEIEAAFHSVGRILKPGGQFLFHISEERLRTGDDPPALIGSKKEPYYPEGFSVPSVAFGKDYLNLALAAANFVPQQEAITDVFSGRLCTWFSGLK
jgi:SAM-dependent methyltransferase